MKQPLNETDSITEVLLQSLPTEFEALAFETKALQRSRQVKNASELLHLVFLYSWLGLSSRLVAARFSCLYRKMTDSAVLGRLAGCGEYLRRLISSQIEIGSEQIKDLSERYLITIVDGSSWGARGGKTSDYRLHLKFSLRAGEWLELLLGDNHLSESLLNYSYAKDELVLADRNYGRSRALVEIDAKGAKFVVRISPSQMRIMDEKGEKWEWLEILEEAEQSKGRYEKEVRIKGLGEAEAKVRIVMGKLPKEKALIAQIKARRQAKHRGGKIKAETLRYAEWVVVLSNLGKEEADIEQILELYRMRWQVEIGIKRLKSLYRIDEMTSEVGSAVGEVRILARLLMALMIERKLRMICQKSKEVRQILGKESSGWRENLWQIKELEQKVWGEVSEELFEQAVKWMKERDRKYRLQRLKKEKDRKRTSENAKLLKHNG